MHDPAACLSLQGKAPPKLRVTALLGDVLADGQLVDITGGGLDQAKMPKRQRHEVRLSVSASVHSGSWSHSAWHGTSLNCTTRAPRLHRQDDICTILK